MTIEQKSEKIAELLVQSKMTEDERDSWLEAIVKMSKEQLEQFITTFENELREISELRAKTVAELAPKIAETIRDKY